MNAPGFYRNLTEKFDYGNNYNKLLIIHIATTQFYS